MRGNTDPLYIFFEQRLFNALVEDETTDAFLDAVVSDYMLSLRNQGIVPANFKADVERDLRDDVRDMLKKKIYGHYDLVQFRKSVRVRPGL
jgi:hypothetical protein